MREKTRLTESTGQLIQEGRGKIGGEFTLQVRESNISRTHYGMQEGVSYV